MKTAEKITLITAIIGLIPVIIGLLKEYPEFLRSSKPAISIPSNPPIVTEKTRAPQKKRTSQKIRTTEPSVTMSQSAVKPEPTTKNTITTEPSVAMPPSTEIQEPVEKAIPEFTLTVSNIIGFPQNVYALEERLSGLPGVQNVSVVASSFQSETRSAKYYIKFEGGDNKELVRLIRSKTVLFTFDRQVKYQGEWDIGMWVAY